MRTRIPCRKPTTTGLEQAQRRAYEALRTLWTTGLFTKPEAYRWMSLVLKVDPSQAVVRKFTRAQCKTVLREATALQAAPEMIR